MFNFFQNMDKNMKKRKKENNKNRLKLIKYFLHVLLNSIYFIFFNYIKIK